MKSKKWCFIIPINILVFFSIYLPIQAQEYPLFFIGGNIGYGQNELNPALSLKAFLRYSVEAYIPGLQFETSYSTNLFKQLQKEENQYEAQAREILETKIRDHQAAVSAAFHIKPITKETVIYFGGGLNINFLSMDSIRTDKYWDSVAEKEQEKKDGPFELLRQTIPGYHLCGGLRFDIGGGSFDIEFRITFLVEQPTEWSPGAPIEYRDKKWDSWSINIGFTKSIW